MSKISFRLFVSNYSGQLVRNIWMTTVSTGEYEMIWDGRDETGELVRAGKYQFVLETEEGIDTFPVFVGDAQLSGKIAVPMLMPNHPNPFNSSTLLSFRVPENLHPVLMSLGIYNALARR